MEKGEGREEGRKEGREGDDVIFLILTVSESDRNAFLVFECHVGRFGRYGRNEQLPRKDRKTACSKQVRLPWSQINPAGMRVQ